MRRGFAMLSEITIENVAVIEKAQISFGPGFTVLTGETGAGKSIMIDSINAILGNRTSKDLVRSGAEKARIWAAFEEIPAALWDKLEEWGYPRDDSLLLQREISAEGKNQCRINGMPATAAALREIGGALVQIHGQHDNQSLTQEARHLPLLDLYAGHQPLVDEYYQAYSKLQQYQKAIAELSMNEAEKARKIELLRYELDEIDGAELEEGEEEDLLERRKVVRNAQALLEALHAASEALSGGEEEPGAASLLGQASSQLDAAAEIAAPLSPLADSLREAFYSAREWERELQHSIDEYSAGEESIDQIEARLDLLYRLKQKYGPSVEAVLDYGRRARQELEGIESSSERLAALEKEKRQQETETKKLASRLTEARKQAFARLCKETKEALAFLNMPGARMELRYTQTPLGPTGQDELEFLFSANPGEEPRPLAKIASGGELARVMLAVKNALAQRDDMPTVIYDEIDTGISGQTAGKIGRMLQAMAEGRQVICVTHTAQIAAFAGAHLYIEKQVEKGRTYTAIRPLSREERVAELARIVSGDSQSQAARANANEMLAAAGQ